MTKPETIFYADIRPRARAVLIDCLILACVLFASGLSLKDVAIAGYLKAAIVACLFLVLEVGLVSLAGGTIGHLIMGLRVQNARVAVNIGPFRAALRSIVKFLFGMISLIFILITRRSQAIHDLAANSVVIDVRPSTRNYTVVAGEQEIEENAFSYPSGWRRGLVIIVYIVALNLILGILNSQLLSSACFNASNCSEEDDYLAIAIGVLDFAGMAVVIVYGWLGRLWGCRRKPIDPIQTATQLPPETP